MSKEEWPSFVKTTEDKNSGMMEEWKNGKRMGKWLLVIIFSFSFNVSAFACRFTVREIGFSTLSQDIYSLVVIDQNTNASDQFWQSIRDKLEDSNIRLVVLNPDRNAEHPFVKQVLDTRLSLPALVLISPDGRMLKLNNGDLSKHVDEVLDSPVRRRLRNDLFGIFSVILWVDGKNEVLNSKTDNIIKSDCERIESIIPYMPKKVRNGPISIHITASEFMTEKVLLWSLGIDKLPDEPVAFVLYGRGRIMGGAVDASAISEGRLYNYMSMIGADCECGLDRKWMLGNQIPMLWSSESRQQLADEVGFDVDNPMIQAEMSRIMAKETNPDIAGDVDFGIDVIDLNTAFEQTPVTNDENTNSGIKPNHITIIMLVFALLIVITGLFIFYRNRYS